MFVLFSVYFSFFSDLYYPCEQHAPEGVPFQQDHSIYNPQSGCVVLPPPPAPPPDAASAPVHAALSASGSISVHKKTLPALLFLHGTQRKTGQRTCPTILRSEQTVVARDALNLGELPLLLCMAWRVCAWEQNE